MRLTAKIMAIVCLLSLAGCASIFNGSSQMVSAMTSNGKPVKAMVSNAGSSYYTNLPTNIAATHDSNSVSILVKDKKYQTSTYTVPKSITPSFWVNILFWPGFLIDMATGDMWTYPTNVIVPVTPKNS